MNKPKTMSEPERRTFEALCKTAELQLFIGDYEGFRATILAIKDHNTRVYGEANERA